MTQQEFEIRTGLEVDSVDFTYVHEAYMATPADKDVFCHGIKTPTTLALVIILGKRIKEANDLRKAVEVQRDNVVNYLFEQSINPDTEAMTEKARELLGRDEYLARLVEAGETPNDEDLHYIASKIRRQ